MVKGAERKFAQPEARRTLGRHGGIRQAKLNLPPGTAGFEQQAVPDLWGGIGGRLYFVECKAVGDKAVSWAFKSWQPHQREYIDNFVYGPGIYKGPIHWKPFGGSAWLWLMLGYDAPNRKYNSSQKVRPRVVYLVEYPEWCRIEAEIAANLSHGGNARQSISYEYALEHLDQHRLTWDGGERIWQMKPDHPFSIHFKLS